MTISKLLLKLSNTFSALLFFSIIMLQTVSSQPVITENSLSTYLSGEFNISQTLSTDAENIFALIDLDGPDQVFDFTTLTFDESFSAEGIIETNSDISGTPGEGDSHFEQATHVNRFSFAFEGDVDGEDVDFDMLFYNYIIYNDDELITLGSIQVDGEDPEDIESKIYNRPGEIDFLFPVNYEDTWEYEYESEMETSFGTITSDVSVMVEVDGWGELITSEGSFDVLRITKTETTDFFGFEIESLEINFVNEYGIQIASITTEEDPETGEYDEDSTDATLLNSVSEGTSTSNEDYVTDMPEHIRLDQNFPNPFNPSTQITYQLSNPSNVTLEVYSITGEKIMTLVKNSFQQPGSHSVPFEAEDLASGIYIYRLTTGEQTLTRKMTLLK